MAEQFSCHDHGAFWRRLSQHALVKSSVWLCTQAEGTGMAASQLKLCASRQSPLTGARFCALIQSGQILYGCFLAHTSGHAVPWLTVISRLERAIIVKTSDCDFANQFRPS